ncbi:MAG: hypothetical protein ILP02_01880 [Clostridia bacterium]|nr:hypothetical protein [Clostridia bacterium]
MKTFYGVINGNSIFVEYETFSTVFFESFGVVGLWLLYLTSVAKKRSAVGIGFIKAPLAYNYVLAIIRFVCRIVLTVITILTVLIVSSNPESGSSAFSDQSAVGYMIVISLIVSEFVINVMFYSSIFGRLNVCGNILKGSPYRERRTGIFAAVMMIIKSYFDLFFGLLNQILIVPILEAVRNEFSGPNAGGFSQITNFLYDMFVTRTALTELIIILYFVFESLVAVMLILLHKKTESRSPLQ